MQIFFLLPCEHFWCLLADRPGASIGLGIGFKALSTEYLLVGADISIGHTGLPFPLATFRFAAGAGLDFDDDK